MSFASLTARKACLIEIEADGLIGVGESWINYPEWGHRERIATVCDGLAPHVVGKDVSDPRKVQAEITAATLSVARQWGAPGPIWQAISGIDLALWDLKGKAEQLPVGRLLSETAARQTVPAYASGIGPDRVPHWCERALGHGLTAAKVKLGFGPDTDRAVLNEARQVLGQDLCLLADVNQGWTLDEAIQAIPAIEPYDLGWLEEPISGDRLADLELLADRTHIPLATGENLYGMAALKEYTEADSVGVIQPDLTKSGGITIAAQVARHSTETSTPLAPHCYGSAVGVAASLQLAYAFPTVDRIELDIRDNPLRTDLLEEPLTLRDGQLLIPQQPGLGVQLNRETVARYTISTEERSNHDR